MRLSPVRRRTSVKLFIKIDRDMQPTRLSIGDDKIVDLLAGFQRLPLARLLFELL